MPLEQIDSDVELMLAFCRKDESAFVKLLNRYEKPLLNYIFRFIGNRQEAEDLTQDVFVRVYRARNYYQAKGSFKNWIYKIAANLCLNYKRKAKALFLDEKIFVIKDESPTDKKIDDEDKIKLLKSALQKLPQNQRLALLLAKYENRSYKEIAEILDCSVSAVEALLFRARQNLKNFLAAAVCP